MSFDPVFDENSRILVLGTYPSPASRSIGFYYGHPQNRFWPIIAAVLGMDIPGTIPEKRGLLLKSHIALWDVLDSCDITGAADSSIKNPTPNDIAGLVGESNIKAVFANGNMAAKLYQSFWGGKITLPFTCLPSTSPANAVYTPARLLERWAVILDRLH